MMRSWLLLIALGSLLPACTRPQDAEIGWQVAGGECQQASDCAPGFDCVQDSCTVLPVMGQPMRGEPCDMDGDPDECGPDLVCGAQSVCTESEGLPEGSECALGVECAYGLLCNGKLKVCEVPAEPRAPGQGDLDDACVNVGDCRRPYVCAIHDEEPSCRRVPFVAPPACLRTEEETGAFRAYHELPVDPLADDFEFYRLPFPNDIRRPDGVLSLEGHIVPEPLAGIDVEASYVRSIERQADGFAINGASFFRFTDAPVYESICVGEQDELPRVPEPAWFAPTPEHEPTLCEDGGPPTQYIVNIDPESAAYGTHAPVEVKLTINKGQYICQNALGIAPRAGMPLSPGTTYAAVVTRGLRDVRGEAPRQDDDFVRVLNADPSLTDSVLRATQPLRDWIRTEGIDRDQLAAAAVFTTGRPADMGERVHQAVAALPPPAFDDGAFECHSSEPVPTRARFCGELLPGDAPQLTTRRCPAEPSERHYEVHGTYQAPLWQLGVRPYLRRQDGGELSMDGRGELAPEQGTETMCLSLTVPRQGSGPWPVVIYAHGTSGHYRSLISRSPSDTHSLLDRLTDAGFAVVGYDGVLHGPRQVAPLPAEGWPQSAKYWQLSDPGQLFFNAANPTAGRDNVLQGAADLHYLVRLLREGTLTVPGGPDTRIDPDQVYFIGHSQGSAVGAPFLRNERHVRAAVLSGASAELPLSILHKQDPVPLARSARAFFADQNLTRIHPMMGLIAMLFGPSDTIAHAPQLVEQPGRDPLPLLMVSGVRDTYAPDVSQHALIRALGVPLVGESLSEVDGVPVVQGDASSGAVEAGAVQFHGRSNGHFVMFERYAAQTVVEQFLTSKPQRVER